MKKILERIFKMFIVIISGLSSVSVVYADAMGIYGGGDNGFTKIGQSIAGYIMYFAEAFAIGMLIIMGIKFVISAPEGKADAKKRVIPWAIGVVILFSLNALLDQVANIGSQLN